MKITLLYATAYKRINFQRARNVNIATTVQHDVISTEIHILPDIFETPLVSL